MRILRILALLPALTLLASCAPEPGGTDRREEPAPPQWEEPSVALLSAAQPVSASLDAEDEDVDLSYPREFAITRPASPLTTSYAAYFITGTSDPTLPLYFGEGEDREEILRQGKNGLFGVHVSLEDGENTFTFSQGEDSAEVSITREVTQAPRQPATGITASFPTLKAGVKAGQELALSCTAPSGSSVAASFGGVEVELEQEDDDIAAGYAARFSGSIPISGDYKANLTVNAGPVTYTLDGGESFPSEGDVYVAGEDSYIALRVNSYMGFLYPNLWDLSAFREKPKEGATDYVRNQNGEYFELASGGFLPIRMADILEGEVALERRLGRVSLSPEERGERITFGDAATSMYRAGLTEDAFTITLYNVYGKRTPNLFDSALFSGVTVEPDEENNSVAYTFHRTGEAIWGYNISFQGEDMALDLFYKPLLSTGDQPLEGLRVVLDPGHGGSDGGAYGVPGELGPTESAINLAQSYAIRDRLEALGADVVFTRARDEYYALEERLADVEWLEADLFLSVHHNSLAESTDANRIAGMEIYFHTGLSRELAYAMMSGLSGGLDRDERFVSQSYYRVTLSPYAPSLLLELGYLCNPAEYEAVTDPDNIAAAAEAVAQGILNALS